MIFRIQAIENLEDLLSIDIYRLSRHFTIFNRVNMISGHGNLIYACLLFKFYEIE